MSRPWRSMLRAPLAIAGIGIILTAIGVGMSAGFSPLSAMPNLALIIGFMIVGKGSAILETLAMLILGLCADLLTGDLLGAGTIGLLVGLAVTRGLVMRLDSLRPAWKAYVFPLFAIIAMSVEWALTSLAAVSMMPLSGTVIQFFLTCALFACYALFRQLLRRWSARPARYAFAGVDE